MRIFAVTPNYPPASRVGAWLSTHALLAHLASCGHSVTVLPLAATITTGYRLDGVDVIPFERGHALDAGVRAADVVVSHCGDNGAAGAACAKYSTPNLRMAHGPLHPDALAGAALVVFNSHALAATVDCPVPSIVVHPPVDPDRWRTIPGDRVTLVNLSEAKGGELFWRLARCAPHRQFLGVRGGYGAQYIDRLPNVELLATTTDMRRDVYSRTRILLMPSATETYGMTAIEALASGIPVVAHPTPGLLESLGPAGTFVDRADGQGWLDQIERLHDPTEWAESAAAARARSVELHPGPDLARFAAAVDHLGAPCAPSSSFPAAPTRADGTSSGTGAPTAGQPSTPTST